MKAIMNIEYRKGGNDIAAAVRYMDQEMFKVNHLAENSVMSSYIRERLNRKSLGSKITESPQNRNPGDSKNGPACTRALGGICTMATER